MSVTSSRKPCCWRSKGMTSFSTFLMKSPARSAFKCMDTLRANIELSWATRPRERFRGIHGSGRPESSLDRISRMRHFTSFVKLLAADEIYFTVAVKPNRRALVDVCFVIQQRLKELGLEQRDLAAAAQVTESYISQLLTRKKAPPAAGRTDLYEKMNAFLKLPKGQLSAMVEAQRREELKKKLADPPAPLFKEVRELIIRKCKTEKRTQVREIFENQAFGELERLVTQTLLDVTKGIAREELETENWPRNAAKLRRQSPEEMRAITLDFLDTDVFNVSIDHCAAFLDPLIDSWDIDLRTFGMEIALNNGLA